MAWDEDIKSNKSDSVAVESRQIGMKCNVPFPFFAELAPKTTFSSFLFSFSHGSPRHILKNKIHGERKQKQNRPREDLVFEAEGNYTGEEFTGSPKKILHSSKKIVCACNCTKN